MTPSIARLHVLLASENDFALVIRRGPTKHVCTLGWNRANDQFELGQWLKGRIGNCDLSPDGRHFIYGASKYDPSLNPNYESVYSVVSRAPFLKALHFWSPKKWTYGGGFFDNERVWVLTNNSVPEVRRLPDFARIENAPELATLPSTWSGIDRWRRERQGGKLLPKDYQRRKIWHKTLGEWTLVYSMETSKNRLPETYELRYNATDEVVASGQWQWADFDVPRKRLCFARDGQLWALDLKSGATQKIIHDFNSMAFEPIVAPY